MECFQNIFHEGALVQFYCTDVDDKIQILKMEKIGV